MLSLQVMRHIQDCDSMLVGNAANRILPAVTRPVLLSPAWANTPDEGVMPWAVLNFQVGNPVGQITSDT